MENQDLIDEYLSTLDITTIDRFRSLFYEASEKQLIDISERYENTSGMNKEWIYDDGVQANMIRWLGEELILISLHHTFEIKMKEIIRYKQSSTNRGDPENNDKLHRWDELKKHIPTCVKSTSDFQQVNILRVLVNCFKHAGIVNSDLNKLDSSFGNIGSEITCDLSELYKKYKVCTSSVIRQAYNNET